MKKTETDTNDVTTKTAKLLAGAKTVYLATNGSHGHPNLRAMAPVKVEGVKTIWFVTIAGSCKVSELQNDKHAVVYVEIPRMGGECRFWGYVEVLDDKESRKEVWNDKVKEYFPEGVNSPNMKVLRFDVTNGIYTNKNMENFTFEND